MDLDIAEIGCDTDPEELLRSLRASYPQLIDFVELDAARLELRNLRKAVKIDEDRLKSDRKAV